jgi:Skp family chaperone for outer membrane proteins
MMKKLSLLALAAFLCSNISAQSRTATIEYAKVNREAVVNEILFPEKTVRNAIDDKMQKSGYKGKDSKGFTIYRGVRLPQIGNEAYDMYFMVDRKSKKEKESSVVTLMVSKGYDNFVSDSVDIAVINNAKKYLDSLNIMIAAYDLEMQIADQDDVVKKADKKKNNLVDDGESLQRKKKNIEKEIEDNKAAQAAQVAEFEKQKQILETLKSKRKG